MGSLHPTCQTCYILTYTGSFGSADQLLLNVPKMKHTESSEEMGLCMFLNLFSKLLCISHHEMLTLNCLYCNFISTD